MSARTVPQLVQRAVHEHGPRTALRREGGEGWRPVTYAQLGRLVEEACVGLVERGLEPGDRVGLVAGHGPLEVVAGLATLHAGGTLVPAPADAPQAELAGLLGDAGVGLCFVGAGQAPRLAGLPDRVDGLETLAALDEGPGDGSAGAGEGLVPVGDLYAEGRTVLGREGAPAFEERWRALKPGDLAVLVAPRGGADASRVGLTHRNLVANVEALGSALELAPGDRFLSVRPLGAALRRGPSPLAAYHRGLELWLADGPGAGLEALRACRPDLLPADPDLLARVRQRAERRLAASAPTQRDLFAWARTVGEDALEARQANQGPGLGLRARAWLADRLVLAKLRAALGLDRVDAAVGAGPLDSDLVRWFHAIGVPVLEGYAGAGAGPLAAVNRPGAFRVGSLGRPLAGVDVRVEAASGGRGEVLVRGAPVAEYPGGAGSRRDGWLGTGDVGRVDADGFLWVDERAEAAGEE